MAFTLNAKISLICTIEVGNTCDHLLEYRRQSAGLPDAEVFLGRRFLVAGILQQVLFSDCLGAARRTAYLQHSLFRLSDAT